VSVGDVKGNGPAMEASQRLSGVVAIIYEKYVLSSLVAVIKQHKGKETGTHIATETNEKTKPVKCRMMVSTHCQSVSRFVFW